MECNVATGSVFTADNLDIMRGINNECIDLIYLDPPYNSGKSWAGADGSEAEGAEFRDTWTAEDVDEEWVATLVQQHPSIAAIIDLSREICNVGMQSYLTMLAVRLLEMHRILKATGSIYLQCDATVCNYIRLLLDAIFGRKRLRGSIVWKRSASVQKGNHYAPRSWGNTVDNIFHYTKGDEFPLSPYRQLTPEESTKKFHLTDKNGRRYYTDADLFHRPSGRACPSLCYEWKGFRNPYPSGWGMSRKRLEEHYSKGKVVITADGNLMRNVYLDEYRGYPLGNIWTDIGYAAGKERTGYPTQKPMKLLKRIIKASSNEGDIVLDPFCGSGTTCLAAEQWKRKWIGIDISSASATIVSKRFEKELDLLTPDIIELSTPPERTDNVCM